MASGMKVWMGLAALGSFAIAAWTLPPSVTVRNTTTSVTPEEVRARALRRELRRSHDVLQHIRWADSLTALALATAQDGVATGGDPQVLQVGTLDSVRVRIGDELRLAGVVEAKAVVGFFVQPRKFAGVEGIPRDGRGISEIYMGESDGQAYCYRVLGPAGSGRAGPNSNEISRYSWSTDKSYSNILKGCRMVARHGLPGPSVRGWLERGGLEFANQPSYGPTRPNTRFLSRTRWAFGLLNIPTRAKDLELDRCLAGIADACEAVVLNPMRSGDELEEDARYVMDRSPVSSVGRQVFRSPFGSVNDYLLGDLEVEFGPDRFAAFWTSDLDTPEAFQAAFGLPLGEWVATWTAARFGAPTRGPRLSKAASSSTIALLMLSALMGGAWARRRRVA